MVNILNSNLTSYLALYPGILVPIFSISYYNVCHCNMQNEAMAAAVSKPMWRNDERGCR